MDRAESPGDLDGLERPVDGKTSNDEHDQVAENVEQRLGANGNIMEQDVDADVGALLHRRGGADPGEIDEGIADDFLAPDRGIGE